MSKARTNFLDYLPEKYQSISLMSDCLFFFKDFTKVLTPSEALYLSLLIHVGAGQEKQCSEGDTDLLYSTVSFNIYEDTVYTIFSPRKQLKILQHLAKKGFVYYWPNSDHAGCFYITIFLNDLDEAMEQHDRRWTGSEENTNG